MKKKAVALLLSLGLVSTVSPALHGYYWLLKHDEKCLTSNVYHEARGEPFIGQVHVASVVINRIESGKFPKTVCAVVYQPKQFSWVGVKEQISDSKAYTKAYFAVMYAIHYRSTEALYFHSTAVKPSWSKGKVFLEQVGNHLFYK